MTVCGVHAAGLGRLNVQSALGQPLRAEVEVPSVGQDEAATLQVRLAPQSAFRQANLEFNPALTQLRFDLESRNDGSYIVHVTSAQPVNEPFLDLLLELSWSTGRVLREYTVLLDPPALKTAPEVVSPVATQTQPVAPPAPAAAAEAAPAPAPMAQTAPAPVPAPAPPAPAAAAPAPMAATPKPAPSAARAKPAPAEAPAVTRYQVKPGDTLGRIAQDNRPASVSLDQMLVALLRANPNAFINNNMNLVLAGRTLSIPSESDARAVDASDAHREVIAQSADFDTYRSRIAQAAAAAPPPAPSAPKSAVQGKVVAKVEEKGAPPKSGDQLKIAKAEAAASAATQSADETQMRQRMLKEEQARADALKKTNEKLARELEVVSKAAALAQQQAKAKADAEQLKAEQAAAKARAEADAAKARADAIAAKAKAQADAAAAKAKAEADAIKAKADAVAAVKARVEAEEAARARAEAKAAGEKAAAEASKSAPAAQPVPVAPPAPATVAKPEPARPAAPAAGGGESMLDQLTSAPVLGGLIVVLLAGLFGINFYRKKKVERSDQFKSTIDGMRANSLFGATGGQSVDTGATSTFNSSFIPAASQLDSNEVDPVAEADVYIAYGREEQAEEILKEALRLQPDRVGVRVKMLEIYSRRGEKAAFISLAQDLHDRSGGSGEEWERAAKLGRSLDPSNPMFSGGAPSAGETAHGPITELRLAAAASDSQAASAKPGATAPEFDGMGTSVQPFSSETRATVQPGGGTVLGMSPSTRQGLDSRMGGDTKLPVDSQVGPSTRGPMVSPPPAEPPRAAPQAPTLPMEEATKAISGIDFGALDFDLGPTKAGSDGATVLMPVPEERQAPAQKPAHPQEAPTVPSIDLMFEPTTPATTARRAGSPTAAGSVPMPEIDLNLPTMSPGTRPTGAPSSLEEALSRPTLLGAVGALPDEQASRLNSNTDQATVPLIDFDLSGTETTLSGRRTETQAGTPLASQMATKLDLARGYIDLGVKDGARELLEEVMRDGTREQRQQAVELIKMVEA
ncbi:MAG TPA: FimV/HubP family polar landmark protein [Burkholderiaceae bacterium]|nr:FimV/HubP family polar landmark protein [Burkholderiaceae bacterium]